MTRKEQMILELQSTTINSLIQNSVLWTDFLKTASNNYKYSFDEQLLIYAQKPQATACASFEFWNKLGRWIKPGVKGIALFDDRNTHEAIRTRYVFNVSDTTNKANSSTIYLWQMKEEHQNFISESLGNSFGEVNNSGNFYSVLCQIAQNVVNDNSIDYYSAFLSKSENGVPEEIFNQFVEKSVIYILACRCSVNISEVFGTEDYYFLKQLNANQLAVVGKSLSDISEIILREIEKTIKGKFLDTNFAKPIANDKNLMHNVGETNQTSEGSNKNGEKSITENNSGRENGNQLHTGGRLLHSGLESDRGQQAISDKLVRTEENGVFKENTADRVLSDENNGDITSSLDGDRQVESGNAGAVNQSNDEVSGSDRGAQDERPDDLGGNGEQYSLSSERDNSDGTGLRIEFPSVDEQIELIERAEAEKSASALSISQKDIDAVLQRGSGISEGKFRIFEQYDKKKPHVEIVSFLREEYGWGGAYPALPDRDIDEGHDGKGIKISRGTVGSPDAEVLLPWKRVEKRIGELIKADRYLNAKEKELYPEYIRQKQLSTERWEIGKEFKSIICDYNDFQLSINNRDACLNQYILNDCGNQFGEGRKTTWTLSTNNYIMPIMREAMNSIIQSQTQFAKRAEDMLVLLDGDLAKPLEPSYDELNPPPEPEKEYRFSLGDVVYIGAGEYEIQSYSDDIVKLIDVNFPLLTEEMPRADFDIKMKENPLNNHLLVEVEDMEIEDDESNDSDSDKVVKDKAKETTEQNIEKETLVEKAIVPIISKPKQRTESYDLFPQVPMSQRSQFSISDNTLGEGTPSVKYQRNLEAIELVKKLEEQKRYASPEEQLILSQYVGWGGLSDYFDESKTNLAIQYAKLKDILSDEEYSAARESTLTAFYTPPIVIKAMYKALDNMGFKRGNILEPSCGIGNFIGMLPESMKDSKVYGIELDKITGSIASQLYQKSSIAVQGFEKTNLPDSFFDVAIGNVPFGQFKVSDKRYDKHNFLIHDYFFARTLDKVRPGGVIAFITSKGTLDKENCAVRKYIAQRADLLGAIRLPNNAFKANAATEVTADIIFLQRRDKMVDIEPEWVHLGKDNNGIAMNSYFIEHPEMIMGQMVMESTQYGMDSACKARDEKPLEEMLYEAVQNIHAKIDEYETEELDEDEIDKSIPADPGVRNFSYTVVDDKVYFRENSRMNPVDVSVTAQNRIKGLIDLRQCLRMMIDYQLEDYSDEEISSAQSELNNLYDTFSKKYGLVSSRANTMAFESDSSYPLLCSLENVDENGQLKSKADIFTKRTIKPHTPVTSVDTASEALALSIAEKAMVNMEYMEQLTGKTEQELFKELKGVIFLNPLYGYGNNIENKYLPADEYLSGNVREKLVWAKKSAELNPDDYNVNVEALEQVQPQDLSAAEINVRLGATWIPVEDVQRFMYDLFSTPMWIKSKIKVSYSKHTSNWNIEGKSKDSSNIKVNKTYGSSRANGYKILEETLNLKDVRIYDYVEDSNGNKQQVLNKKETTIAKQKQELIKNQFSEWIWKDQSRRERLCRIYNDTFNSVRPREYDGRHITFSGINPEIKLRPHQVNAIAHIMYGGNTLLAHVVGAGKTFEMVAAAMESKRLGLCQKSLFVVPNHLTEQWATEFLQLYPAANILVATKKNFETKNRKKFCGRIATGDYDAIIIGHSQFEKIPMSAERQWTILNEQISEITEGIEDLKRNNGERFSVKQLEKLKKSLQEKLNKLNDQSRKDNVVTFEELGVDRIFIDEAHYYKNLFLYTKMRNVGGIAQTEAQKSSDLFMKCRYLDDITGGRGVVFATGTPISNSMVEMYTMQRYLQYSVLVKNELQHFDSWASTFGETITAIELAPEGTGYRAKTRFAKFYNLPELMSMFKNVADIQTADMLNLPVPKVNFHNVVTAPSEFQKSIVAELSERAERVRNRMVDSTVDNMLKITNDGRKVALDQRLFSGNLPDNENSKVSICANNVFEIWQETADMRSAQLIFCDLSTPHYDGSFNVYDDIKGKLALKGVPEAEIAFIHDANTEVKKKEMFSKVRNGDIRVLIGSTSKMGAGTNVQKKLVAIHDLDCPWRPADLEQRLGRIVRQGNENEEVEVFRYVTEQTFDAYLFQLVENKQKFISQIMTSKSPVRSAEDIDETALSYAEIKALATGNPHIKEKMDLDIEVAKLKLLKANHLSEKYALEDRLVKYYPEQIKELEARIKGYEADIVFRNNNTALNDEKFSPLTICDTLYSEKEAAGNALLAECKKLVTPDPKHIGSYRGFKMYLSFETYTKNFKVTLKNKLSHFTLLGDDIFGNITRLDNALGGFESKNQHCKQLLEDTLTQQKEAEIEVNKPFVKEAELKEKSARLDELNILLNMDQKDSVIMGDDERPANNSAEFDSEDEFEMEV